eukprot:g9868.t1
MNDNPLQLNDIGKLELEMGNDEEQELTRCRKCRILCGRESLAVTVVVLALGGENICIFYAYTLQNYGSSFNQEGVWVFFALAILSCLLALSFIVRIIIAIQPKKQKKQKEGEEKDKKLSKIAAAVKGVVACYNHLFDVNGKYYLSKMYAAELLISVHLATQPSTDKCSGMFTNEVWEGCQAKVPFCQDLFVAKCDCAVLGMTNYTQRALPASFGGLKSLVELGVYTGQLEELPQQLGDNHKRMVVLMVIGNKLQALPDSVGNLQNLLTLWVFNNRLKSLPDSVGNLQNLLNLRVFNNRLKSLPDSVGNLQNLLNLRVFNNRLKSLPDSVGNLQNLQRFLAWNNTLTSLPETGDMESLTWVDVRHNGLTDLPSSVRQWSNIEYLHLAGNPLCADLDIPSNLKGVKGLCEQQCSVDCPSVWLGNGFCANDYIYENTKNYNPNAKPKPNTGCNTAACEYDKGDCPR